MAQVVSTQAARQDLSEIGRYIADNSSLAIAHAFLDRIESRCTEYARHPRMGQARTDLGTEVRCFTVASYVVFYRPLADGVLVLRVLHGARDIPAEFRRFVSDEDDSGRE